MKVTVVDKVYNSYNLPIGTLIFAKKPDSEPDCWWNSLGMILKYLPPEDGYTTQAYYTILFANGSVRVEFESYVVNYYDWELRIK